MTFFRYILIQIVAYGIDVGVFLIIFKFEVLGPVAANFAGKLVAGAFAFVAHRGFTFQAVRGTSGWRQATRYLALLALNVALASFALMACLPWIEPPALAKLAADLFCVLLTYWLSRRFVFVMLVGGRRQSGAPRILPP